VCVNVKDTMYQPENKTLACAVKDTAGLLDVLQCARDHGIARIVGTVDGQPFEIDRSDEIEAERLGSMN
jgi:hypothetical protein